MNKINTKNNKCIRKGCKNKAVKASRKSMTRYIRGKANQRRILETIMSSKGRFFGLYTKGGESINAQLVSESPSYVTVYDRNEGVNRKFAKTSLCGVRLSGNTVGKVS